LFVAVYARAELLQVLPPYMNSSKVTRNVSGTLQFHRFHGLAVRPRWRARAGAAFDARQPLR